MKNFLQNWKCITSDPVIIDIVKNGLKIDFNIYPPPTCVPCQYPFNETETKIIDHLMEKLLTKKVVIPADIQKDDFFSPIFTRPKKDNDYRFILNLKQLNLSVNSPHFKMDSIKSVQNIIKPNVWLASIDLKDAFYTVPIHADDQKYLKFYWGNQAFKFTALPNGYGPATLIFTKILKAPFQVLRMLGHLSVVFVDDSYLQGDTYAECINNINDTIHMLTSLGFTIHPEKSIFTPTQEITFLGFVINSKTMTLKLTEEKISKLKNLCSYALKNKNKIKIREVAKIIGNIIAAIEATTYGKLYYRNIENQKILALKDSKGNFDAHMSLSDNSQQDIHWWMTNIDKAYKSLTDIKIDYVIYTDASHLGWGATDKFYKIGGQWTTEEQEFHINILELLAIKFALYALVKAPFKHVRIMCDNTTAISYINKMGGIKSPHSNLLAKEIWEWAADKNIWLSAAHIPGKDNIIADYKSRNFELSAEWGVTTHIFNKIIKQFGMPDIDLFATRLNKQVTKFVSWQPDPEAFAIDAMTLNWNNFYSYCFPPFSIIAKTLMKIRHDRANAVIVVPMWTTQQWFPMFLRMLVSTPLIFSSNISNLHLVSHPNKTHPLFPKLKFLVAKVSGNSLACLEFQKTLETLSCPHGGKLLHQNIHQQLTNGKYFVLKGKKIPYTLL